MLTHGSHIAQQSYFAFSASSFLVLLSIPLLFFPRLLSLLFGSSLTELEDHGGNGAAAVRQLAPLEKYLSCLLGLTLDAFAMLLVIYVSVI
jgi:hypothetical protein